MQSLTENDNDSDDLRSQGEALVSLVKDNNVEKVTQLLADGFPASYQTEEKGASLLMVAAGAGSLQMVSLLLEHGAPWNALDRSGKCAGEYALAEGHQQCVDMLVSAGVGAELLFGAVDRQTKQASLPVQARDEHSLSSGSCDVSYDAHFPAAPGQYLEDRGVRYDGDNLLDSADDAVMMAWEAPLMEAHADALCNCFEAFGDAIADLGVNPSTAVAEYSRAVNSKRANKRNKMARSGDVASAVPQRRLCGEADAREEAEVPGGEKDSSDEEATISASLLSGRTVLNVGFGMGIVDSALQRRLTRPQDKHFIVEPHPAVLAKMVADGWMTPQQGNRTDSAVCDGDGGGRGDAGDNGGNGVTSSSQARESGSSPSSPKKYPNVTVLRGTWQDTLRTLEATKFDSVFFDTYGERYTDMAEFHALLPRLLKPGGTYSFFNGMCPFNLFFHGVACQLVKTELEALNFRTVFVPLAVEIPDEAKTWGGVTRKYWQRDTYYLPVSVFLPEEGKPSAFQ